MDDFEIKGAQPADLVLMVKDGKIQRWPRVSCSEEQLSSADVRVIPVQSLEWCQNLYFISMDVYFDFKRKLTNQIKVGDPYEPDCSTRQS